MKKQYGHKRRKKKHTHGVIFKKKKRKKKNRQRNVWLIWTSNKSLKWRHERKVQKLEREGEASKSDHKNMYLICTYVYAVLIHC